MADNIPLNELIDEIVVDLSTIFNQPFTTLQNVGNEELTAISKRLAGVLVQPTSTNIGQYETAKGYLMQNGASAQAASTLAILVANLAKLSGKSINTIMRKLESSGIRLTEETYVALNQLRDPESQWFYAEVPDNTRSVNRTLQRLGECECPDPIDILIEEAQYYESNFVELTLTTYNTVITNTPPEEVIVLDLNTLNSWNFLVEDETIADVDLSYIEIYPTNPVGYEPTLAIAKGIQYDSWGDNVIVDVYENTVPVGYGAGEYVMKFVPVGSSVFTMPSIYTVNDVSTETAMAIDTWVDMYAPAGLSVDGAGTWKIYIRRDHAFDYGSDVGIWDIIYAEDDGGGSPVPDTGGVLRWKGGIELITSEDSPEDEGIYDEPATPIQIYPDGQLIWKSCQPLILWKRDQTSVSNNITFIQKDGGWTNYSGPDRKYKQSVATWISGETAESFDRYATNYWNAWHPVNATISDDEFIVKVTHVSDSMLDTIEWTAADPIVTNPSAYDTWFPLFQANFALDNAGADLSYLISVNDITVARNTTPDGTASNCVPISGSEQTRRVKFVSERDDTVSSTRPPPDALDPPSGSGCTSNPMELVFVTSTPSQVITLPLTNTDDYSNTLVHQFRVDWGDGSHDFIWSYNQAERAHTYVSTGTYTVTITGIMQGMTEFSANGNSHLALTEISQWGDTDLRELWYTFDGCINMTITASDVPNLSMCQTMYGTFTNCTFTTGLADWDFTGVNDMSFMLAGNTSYNEDVSGWDVFRVRYADSLFSGCTSFNGDVTTWMTHAMQSMGNMFNGASSFNQDISGWNIESCYWHGGMLTGATSFSTANYDLLLNAWSTQAVVGSSQLDVSSNYTTATSQAARDILTVTNSWTINDLGGI